MRLVYIMDPHCGWCYGNSENIKKLVGHFSDLKVELLVGGMLLGQNAPYGGPGLSDFIQSHSPRMVEMTGAEVSQKYYDVVSNPKVHFSSLEPSAAMVYLGSQSDEHPVKIASFVQRLLFFDGLDLTAASSYENIVSDLGLSFEKFENEWLSDSVIASTEAQFAKAKSLCNGFPALIAMEGDETGTLASGYFDYEKMVEHIEKILQQLNG